MIEIRETETYKKWFKSLRDKATKAIVQTRIRRISLGNFGDVKSLGDGLSEIRINYGPGFRIYYFQEGNVMVVLLCGGDKSTQQNDIQKALELMKEVKE